MALTMDADHYIFADTGDEKQETYDFIRNFLVPKMAQQDKILEVVQYSPMYQWYWDNRGIPTRSFRSCTDKFKIRPIRKFMRDQGIEKATMLLGITLDEYQRMKQSNVKWIDNEYPLIDAKLTRVDLYKWWMKNYSMIPPKSGCYYCPYMGQKKFIEYTKKHPEVKEKIIALENRARDRNDKLILFKRPLEHVFNIIDNTPPLDRWFEEEECEGVCFV